MNVTLASVKLRGETWWEFPGWGFLKHGNFWYGETTGFGMAKLGNCINIHIYIYMCIYIFQKLPNRMGSQDSHTFENIRISIPSSLRFHFGRCSNGCSWCDGMMLDPFFGTMRLSCQWNLEFQKGQYTPEVQQSPWKMMVQRLLSFWDDIFSGAMQNFQGVYIWWCTR